MKSSHPIGQEPNGLIPFSQIIAAVEKERSMIPFVNEPFGPGKRFGEGAFEAARWEFWVFHNMKSSGISRSAPTAASTSQDWLVEAP